MVKELSIDRKRSLNDGENIKLVTLMLGLRMRVFPKPSAQNDLSPPPPNRPQLFVSLDLGEVIIVTQNVVVTW